MTNPYDHIDHSDRYHLKIIDSDGWKRLIATAPDLDTLFLLFDKEKDKLEPGCEVIIVDRQQYETIITLRKNSDGKLHRRGWIPVDD